MFIQKRDREVPGREAMQQAGSRRRPAVAKRPIQHYLLVRWTLPALLMGQQTVARVPWSDRTAKQFAVGDVVPVYARLPRRGGRPLALAEITAAPVREPLSAMPDSDYEASGWKWLYEHPEVFQGIFGRAVSRHDFSPQAYNAWRKRQGQLWTVRFRLVAILAVPSPVAEPPELEAAELPIAA